MFFFLSKLLDIMLSPFSWGVLLVGAAIPWRASRRSARRVRRLRILGVVGLGVLLVAALPPVANWALWRLEHEAPPTVRSDVTYDAVVLLGGVVDEEVTHESGQPSYNDNVERVVMTHRLLRDGRARMVVVSGGTMDPRHAAYGEAIQLSRQLEDWGIARERIIIEDKSKNTRENAVFSLAVARQQGFENVLVVTSAFHVPRAADCFRAVGMRVDFMPVDFRAHERDHGPYEWLPRASALANTTGAMREWFGRWIYRAQGYGKGP